MVDPGDAEVVQAALVSTGTLAEAPVSAATGGLDRPAAGPHAGRIAAVRGAQVRLLFPLIKA